MGNSLKRFGGWRSRLRRLQSKKYGPLAKWGRRYLEEEDSLWCKVARSIHGKDIFNWHAAGKEGKCLRSPWVSMSRAWLKIDALTTFRLGNVRRVAFWLDPWESEIPFNSALPRLFEIAILLNGWVADYWDFALASWLIIFHHLLKKIGNHIIPITSQKEKSPSESQDSRVLSLNGSGKFTVKSITHHLSPSFPLDKPLFKAIWKSGSPRRVNILFWIMKKGKYSVLDYDGGKFERILGYAT
ncbi:hypothetical protein E5676_scaffold451G001410 [Cucumis melo var. makuwa]|uniref:Reverse transcriptase zinc-binding domain-containing protein n=1 Tax=Cucumis melo var. makuwa TaxID=1194695 RepID=A0A5D3BQW7_CUCMM|nr:hypothetical protein E5676_scaffold451G001410 [Cucumis melo var. makuwa]